MTFGPHLFILFFPDFTEALKVIAKTRVFEFYDDENKWPPPVHKKSTSFSYAKIFTEENKSHESVAGATTMCFYMA